VKDNRKYLAVIIGYAGKFKNASALIAVLKEANQPIPAELEKLGDSGGRR